MGFEIPGKSSFEDESLNEHMHSSGNLEGVLDDIEAEIAEEKKAHEASSLEAM